MDTLLHRFLAHPGSATAVTDLQRRPWSFDAVLGAAVHLAEQLFEHGVRPGHLVLVSTPGGPGFHIADLAVLLAGAVPAVVPELLPAHVWTVLETVRPRLILTEQPLSASLTRAAADRAVTVHSWQATPAAAVAPSQVRDRAHARAAELTHPAAAVVFTSGTTGAPRAVVLTHQGLLDGMGAWNRHWPRSARRPRNTVSYLPVSHVAQRIMGHYLMCLYGTLVHTSTPHRLGGDLIHHRPQALLGVPHVWARLARAAQGTPGGALRRALGSIDLAVNGAAALDPSLARALARVGLRVAGAYGSTETTVPAFHQPRAGRPGLGVPVGVRWRIDHSELVIDSPHLAAGYVTRWPHTRPVVADDQWWHTGDGAHLHRGQPYLDGRVASTFKTARGRWVSPEPVEAYLATLPHVEQACLIGEGLPHTVALVSAPQTGPWDTRRRQALAEDLTEAVAAQQRRGALPWCDLHQVLVLCDIWDEASGLATSTGKPRRGPLRAHYADLLRQAAPLGAPS
ncbi:AMP-binding protein [Nocardiopsis synnemataformans]|uniref:AMP-binding protein n=1 Tax=Nocardiopsis synnemataformans TaxID=61305 RepID=UPI003EBAC357